MDVKIRNAEITDFEEIQSLINTSAKTLQVDFYQPQVIETALELVTSIEQMITKRTFFVIEHKNNLVACGGYKHPKGDTSAELKAFFVHPTNIKQGLATKIMNKCINDLRSAGVTKLNLTATLSGEAFYKKHGFVESERKDVALSNGASFEVVNMFKLIG